MEGDDEEEGLAGRDGMAGGGKTEPMVDGGRQVAGSGLIFYHCLRGRRKLEGSVWL